MHVVAAKGARPSRRGRRSGLPAGPLYRAEAYHQRYFEKHPEMELGHAEWRKEMP